MSKNKTIVEEEYNPHSFDWKRAIWDSSQRLTKVEIKVDEHLRQHRFKMNWLYGIFGSIFTGTILLLLKYLAIL